MTLNQAAKKLKEAGFETQIKNRGLYLALYVSLNRPVNVLEVQACLDCDGFLFTQAYREVGVIERVIQ